MANLSLTVLPAKVLSDGTHKIRVSLSHKNETRYIPTRFIIDSLNNFKNGRVVGRSDAAMINAKLRGTLSEYQTALDKISVDAFTCTQLTTYLKRHKSASTTLAERWQEYIDELKEEGRTGTAGLHERTKKYFENKFDDYTTFESISPATIKDFDKYLRMIKKLNGTTVGMHMKRLKVIVNAAKRENIVRYEIDPFAFYEMPAKRERELDITVDELKLIRDYKTKVKSQQVARDLFMLSYYLGGINLIDLLKVNFKSTSVLEYIRTKTEHTKKVEDPRIRLTIPEEAKPIIKKWMTKGGKLDFGYKYTYENFRKYVTREIRKMADILNIEKRVVYYSARKSLVQHGYELGIPLPTLEYAIGQTMKENRPIFNYLKIMQKHADDAIRTILDHVK